jgi:hypothetical protein
MRQHTAMEISVLDLKAHCRCGASWFRPAQTAPYRSESLLVCARCGRPTTYGALLEGIGDEAMKRARYSLALLKAARAQPVSPAI